MKIERKTLLKALASVLPGTSKDGSIDQSDCLLFGNGSVQTFNDKVACSAPSPLTLSGAVRASELRKLLEKMTEEVVDVSESGGKVIVKGKRRKAEIPMDREIRLKSAVDLPEEWNVLPDNFSESVEMVVPCAAKDKKNFIVSCVQLSNKGISATDNCQMAFASLKLPLKHSFLVQPQALLEAVRLNCEEMGETDFWLHFRNAEGSVLSCRKYDLTFPPVDRVIDRQGEQWKLPQGLKGAIDRASVFADNGDKDARIKVNIRDKKVRISGVGSNGRYLEEQDTDSDMQAVFHITPKMLINLLRRSDVCEIVPGKQLLVKGPCYTYATSLQVESK